MKTFFKFKVLFSSALTVMLLLMSSAHAAETNKKLSVICTLFPQYDFAKHIVGGRAEVTMLLPPGTESHTFDPKPSDILALNKTDVFIYTGEFMEPWAQRILQSLSSPRLVVVDASSGVPLLKTEEEDGHDAHDGHDHSYDPHIWLNFDYATRMVDNILEGLIKADPKNADFYTANAAAYKMRLSDLDKEFQALFKTAKRNTLVFGGRFAYRYFLDHYGVHYITAYENCSTETEPTLKHITDVIRYMSDQGIRVIYHEELVDPKVARSIAEQTGAQPLLFSTGHNVSKSEFDSGIHFIDIMKHNLENIRKGLE